MVVVDTELVTVTLLAAPLKLPVIVVAEIIPTVIPISLITVPVPIPIVLFWPLKVIDDSPTVKIPVTLASPWTLSISDPLKDCVPIATLLEVWIPVVPIGFQYESPPPRGGSI